MRNKHRLLFLLAALLICLSSCAQNNSGKFESAVKLFANGDYPEAAEAFEKLGDYSSAPTYAAYSRGLVFYDQGQYSAAEPYFAQAREFMYGEERYQYCHAHMLLEAGQFADAAATFAAMGDFEDAPLQAEYCAARLAEENKDYESALYGYGLSIALHDAEDRLYNLQGQLYNRAIALKNESNYADAIILFTMLGDYLSAADQAIECKEIGLEAQYTQADELEAAGDLQGAFDLFHALSSYRDAASRAQTLANQLGIQIKPGDSRY